MVWLRGHWQLVVLTALVYGLWQTPVAWPLKLLVVYLHELSHLLVALLTGGSVVELSVNPMEGGHVMARGGNRFLTLTAGYLGSLFIGMGLLLVALRTHLDRAVLGALGALTLLVAALYVRDGFALLFSVGTGAVLLLIARFTPRTANDLVLRLIGLSSMIYVPFDIISDTIMRSHLQSDARMLAEEFGGTTMIWGVLWLGISLALIWAGLRHGLGANSNLVLRPSRT